MLKGLSKASIPRRRPPPPPPSSRLAAASTARQKATSYFDKSRGSLLITGVHCDIQPSGIQGFNIIDTQQRGRHPRLLKESLSIERRTLLLYPPVKRPKLAGSSYNLSEAAFSFRRGFFVPRSHGVKPDRVLTARSIASSFQLRPISAFEV